MNRVVRRRFHLQGQLVLRVTRRTNDVWRSAIILFHGRDPVRDGEAEEATMKQSPSAHLAEFHETFDLPRSAAPRVPADRIASVRRQLLDEEVAELAEAMESKDLAAIAHELADVVYVAFGTALAYGIDLDAVLAEVHRANMSKLGRDGRPVVVNGKVQKGPDYRPPCLEALLGQ
jgi:predicted HAD superfamily Cof-like phosphohydrolase